MSYLTFTSKYSTNVELAVDDLFQALLYSLQMEEAAFDAIKTIDHAVPIAGTNSILPLFSGDMGLAITPLELSSGTKSILLIMHRLRHPELKWIPSMESMGPNAKNYALSYLLSLAEQGMKITFPLYCTVCDFASKYKDLPCLDIQGNIRTLQEIIVGGY